MFYIYKIYNIQHFIYVYIYKICNIYICQTNTHPALLLIYIYIYIYIYILPYYQMLMDIRDIYIAAGIHSCLSYAEKCNRYFYHIAFLETCKTFTVLPVGLKVTNALFISFVTDVINISWYNTTRST